MKVNVYLLIDDRLHITKLWSLARWMPVRFVPKEIATAPCHSSHTPPIHGF